MRLYELSALMQTGETCALDRESVLSAVIEEALGEGFPLGKTPSKRFTLRLAPYIYPRAEKLMGALMRLKLQTEEGEVLPAGVFRVTEVEREPKQVTLYGADEMSLKMEEGFTDRLSYPMTLKGLLVNATVRELSAGTVASDELSAGTAKLLAAFTVITAGCAAFDRATVTNLLANALHLEYGAGGDVFIKNLSADYAKLVRAWVGNLCVRAADGKYYLLNVGADGSVSASEYAGISGSEISEGVTGGGQTIIETEIAAGDLSASNIKGVYALINRLDAARIDVDSLYAREAFIDRLNTADITANQYLKLALDAQQATLDENTGRLDTVSRYITFSAEGMRQRQSGSVYSTLVNDTGFHIDREGAAGHLASFAGNGLGVEQITLGSIRAKRTSTRGWAWQIFD